MWRIYNTACRAPDKQTISYQKFIQLWDELQLDIVVVRHPGLTWVWCANRTQVNFNKLQVHLPSDPIQPGPIYFKTPRKCRIFGVMCEGAPRQVKCNFWHLSVWKRQKAWEQKGLGKIDVRHDGYQAVRHVVGQISRPASVVSNFCFVIVL